MPSLNIVCIIIFYPYKISLGKAELLISFDRSSYAIFDGIELFTNKGIANLIISDILFVRLRNKSGACPGKSGKT